MAGNEYVPGVCNIGPDETARRRNFGWIALAVAIVLFAILWWTGVNPWWRLVLFLPVAAAASGFLQAHFHFCAGFARQGLFNFGPLGQAQQVKDEASMAKDRRKGTQITLISALIGAAVALASVFI